MGLAKNTVIYGSSSGGCLIFEDLKLQNTPVQLKNYSTSNTTSALSYDNKYLFLSNNFNNHLFDVSGDSWTDISAELGISGVWYTSSKFSLDNSRLIIGKGGAVYIIDIATRNVLYSTSTDVSAIYNVAINADGTKVAWIKNTAPYITVMSISPGSTSATVTTSTLPSPVYTHGNGSYSYLCGLDFNNTGTELAIAKTTYGASIHETATGNELWAVSSQTALGAPIANYTAKPCSSVNSNNIMAVGLRYAAVLFLDIANRTSTVVVGEYSGSSSMYTDSLQWTGDKLYLASNTYAPGLQVIDYPTLSLESTYDIEGCASFAVSHPGTAYKVTGNIVESLEVSTWRCAAYDLQTFKLIDYVDVTGSTFTIALDSPEPVMVVVSPVPAIRWEASTNYVIGTEVFPTNTVSTPFYYRCVGAGVSSATEPAWGTVSGGQTNDGTVVWEMIEGLVQPVAHMPLSPVPV